MNKIWAKEEKAKYRERKKVIERFNIGDKQKQLELLGYVVKHNGDVFDKEGNRCFATEKVYWKIDPKTGNKISIDNPEYKEIPINTYKTKDFMIICGDDGKNIFITSPLEIEDMYSNVEFESPETWLKFFQFIAKKWFNDSQTKVIWEITDDEIKKAGLAIISPFY